MNDHYDDYNYDYYDDDDEILERRKLQQTVREFNAFCTVMSSGMIGSSNPPSFLTRMLLSELGSSNPSSLATSSSSSVQQPQLVVERTSTEVGESSSTPTKNILESKGISTSSIRGESIGNVVNGVCCSICTESWSSEGDHQVSCLPCGHVYGLSCIKKWIQSSTYSKCPQCNKTCGLRDIITLYVSRLSVADDEQQKKIRSLQAENEFLKMKESATTNANSPIVCQICDKPYHNASDCFKRFDKTVKPPRKKPPKNSSRSSQDPPPPAAYAAHQNSTYTSVQQPQLVVERTATKGELSSTPTKNIIESKGSSSSSIRGESINNVVDGVCCSICTESWSSEGDHHVSCLPCGHVYGLSCIKKWIERSSSSKCPQCNKKCGLKDIITLYVSRLSNADDEQQKKILSLQAENEILKMNVRVSSCKTQTAAQKILSLQAENESLKMKFKGECKEMNRIMSEMSRVHEEKYKRLAGLMDDMGKSIRRNLNEAYKRQDE